jgi:hypothetical protein
MAVSAGRTDVTERHWTPQHNFSAQRAELANGFWQLHFDIQARHEPAVHFHSEKELPLLPSENSGTNAASLR